MTRIIALLAVLAAGCNPPPPEPVIPGKLPAASGDVLVTVNGQPITTDMTGVLERTMPPQQRVQLERMKEMGRYGDFVDRVAMSQLLYNEAITKKLHEDPKVQLALAIATRDALAAEMVNQVGEAATTDEKIAAAYEERKVRYKRDSARARHILVKELDKANELKAQLDGGADFSALASANSIDKGSAMNGGELGWFTTGRMVKPFEEAAFGAEVGKVVGPVETQFGYHLILVDEKRDQTPLDEVKDEIRDELLGEAIEAYIKGLRDGAKLEWSDNAWVKAMAATQPKPEAAPAPAGGAPTPTPAPTEGGH